MAEPGSAAAANAATGVSALEARPIEYRDGSTALEGLLLRDPAAPRPQPAVLVAHTWNGRDAFAEGRARQVAGLGYAAFALDMYGKGVRGGDAARNAALMEPLMQDRALLSRRIRAALGVVREIDGVDGARIAAIGYCFGGLCVLDLARSGADIAGVVCFHGLLQPPADAARGVPLRARILVQHGTDDPMADLDAVVRLKHEFAARNADYQIQLHGGCMHAFTNPAANDRTRGTVYDAAADRRSWHAMRGFLEDVFTAVK